MTPFIDGIASPSDPNVSPDGQAVAFVVTTIDVADDRYRRSIWMARGDSASPFTTGDGDTAPRWSPDGRQLAFLRKVDDCPQVAVIDVAGGEARVVTDLDLGVFSEPRWSPDGNLIAFTGTVWNEEWVGLDDDERKRRPRRITRRAYRHDTFGSTHDRRRFVHLLEPREGTVRRLTGSTEDETLPVWSPDGSKVAYVTDLSDNPGFDFGSDVMEVAVDGGQPAPAGPRGIWVALGYRGDGVLCGLGSPGSTFPELARLWTLGDDPQCVSAELDRGLSTFAGVVPRVDFDDDTALVSVVESGTVGVVSVDPEGRVTDVYRGRDVVSGFHRSAGTLATTITRVDSPGRLHVAKDGGVSVHSDFGGRRVETTEPCHLELDGLDVWVYLPPGDGPVPLLLNIHGGPASQYDWGFFDEFQVYAQAGYGVVATNPRGSSGRDREFLRAVVGRGWGEADVEDIDTAVAAALAEYPRLDSQRMGVMGGSYGGFLTAWLIAHQERWKTAIVERGLLCWPSFAGTSDIGGWFADKYLGDPELAWDRSPLRLAHQVVTPTLIIHSEDDYRCPIEQAEQYFSALLANGVHAEFIRFPGEGHELTRSGTPKHRHERFEMILDWLSRTL